VLISGVYRGIVAVTNKCVSFALISRVKSSPPMSQHDAHSTNRMHTGSTGWSRWMCGCGGKISLVYWHSHTM